MKTVYIVHYFKTPFKLADPETFDGANEVWEALADDGDNIWNVWHQTRTELVLCIKEHFGNNCEIIDSEMEQVPQEYLERSFCQHYQ